MLLPGLLCLRGWTHSGDIFYMMGGMLLLSGSLAMFCGLVQRRHYIVSFTVVATGILLLLMIVLKIKILFPIIMV